MSRAIRYVSHLAAGCAAAALLGVTPAISADAGVFAYPNKGQSQEQQDRDRYECHSWAVRETGFDPTRVTAEADAGGYPPPPPPTGSGGKKKRSTILGIGNGGMLPGTGVLGDAATGAGLGAAGGAIAGDAGEGAAIGALAGTALGLLTRATGPAEEDDAEAERRRYQEAQARAQAREQQTRMRQEKLEDYRRAFKACMIARGYTVQ